MRCAPPTSRPVPAPSCVAFIDDMATRYAAADLVICRAGALTVAELAAAGVAAILVPFPHAVDDHQTSNARFLADAGAAILLPQSELSPARLAGLLGGLTRDALRQMAEKARALAKPDAARRWRRPAWSWLDREGEKDDNETARPRHRGTAVKHKVKRIHFVGIGGSGMSGIAEVLLNLGYEVSGSDLAESAATRRLRRLGANGGASATMPDTSPAPMRSWCRPPCKDDNPEVIAARARACAGGAARADAGRADAPQAGHRDRRHARQDHHHQSWSPACSPKAGSIRPSSSAAG